MLLNPPRLILGGNGTGGGGGPSGGDPLTYTVPTGVPDPIIWFSPRDVQLSNTFVFKFNNMGTGGAAYDAVALNSVRRAQVGVQPSWNNRLVTTLPFDQQGYRFDDSTSGAGIPLRTVYGITTYENGSAMSFSGFDGFVNGPSAQTSNTSAMELTGQSGSGSFVNQQPGSPYKNGAPATGAVLPLNKAGLGSKRATAGNLGTLFCDNFDPSSRGWPGLAGDVLMWDVELTDPQIALVDQMLANFYTA